MTRRKTPTDTDIAASNIVLTARMLRHYEECSEGWWGTIKHLMRRVDDYDAVDAAIRAQKGRKP